jgi:hypothetical protein
VSREPSIIYRLVHGVHSRDVVLVGALCLVALIAAFGCDKKATDAAAAKFEISKDYKRGPVTFKIRIDKKEITVADRLHLELEAQAGEDYEVKLPEFGDKLEQFGIVDYTASPAALAEKNVLVQRKSYVLEPFLSGDYKIPAMKVTFRKKGETGEEHEVESEELTVKVKSLLSEKAAALAIKDIEPPVELPRKGAWLYWILGAGFLGLCSAAGFFKWRRKQQDAEAVRRPAHEIACAELERLLAEKLVEKGEVKVFYTGLSDILRRYIENRFALRAPERTTDEFLVELRDASVLAAPHKDLLGEFLRHCDLVKFAEHQPTTPEIQKTFDACKRFIFETEEKPDVPETPEEQTAEVTSHAV